MQSQNYNFFHSLSRLYSRRDTNARLAMATLTNVIIPINPTLTELPVLTVTPLVASLLRSSQSLDALDPELIVEYPFLQMICAVVPTGQ